MAGEIFKKFYNAIDLNQEPVPVKLTDANLIALGTPSNPIAIQPPLVGYVKTATQFIDEAGTPYGIKHVQNKPRVSAMPYLYDIAEGNVTGHTTWSKIGFNPALTTEEDIWSAGGLYVFPTGATAMAVVSSSATDDGSPAIFSGTSTSGSTTSLTDTAKNFTAGTAVAIGDCVILEKAGTTPEWGYVTAIVGTDTLTIGGGFSSGGNASGRTYDVVDKSLTTGAQAVKIEYLDTAYATKNEIALLNGTAEVNLTASPFRINSFRVIATGTGNVPVGNLSLKAQTPTATIYSYITAGFTRARNSVYTVPAGKTLYVTQFSASYGTSGNANKEYARIYTRANREGATGFSTGNIFYPYTEVMAQNNTVVSNIDCPTKLPAMTDIKVSAVATASGAVSTVLRGWLE
jgi:hypothetical protein